MKRTPRSPHPRLRRVELPDGSQVVFEVPAGATTRSAVQRVGLPRYCRPAGSERWAAWASAAPVRAKVPERAPLADADPPGGEPVPAAFVVGASTWCSWSADARASLRAVTSWAKAPGVMRTAALDGPTAQRVRDLAAQHSLAGLDEEPVNEPFEGDSR